MTQCVSISKYATLEGNISCSMRKTSRTTYKDPYFQDYYYLVMIFIPFVQLCNVAKVLKSNQKASQIDEISLQ